MKVSQSQLPLQSDECHSRNVVPKRCAGNTVEIRDVEWLERDEERFPMIVFDSISMWILECWRFLLLLDEGHLPL